MRLLNIYRNNFLLIITILFQEFGKHPVTRVRLLFAGTSALSLLYICIMICTFLFSLHLQFTHPLQN